MSAILDILRQLYLLLWKNYVLRKRKKIRILVEIVWPLFLFLILMWVRTRGLRTFEPVCHFAERPLPSSGLVPFVRTYMCELNYSCSQQPRESFYDYNLFEMTNSTLAALEFVNDQDVVDSVSSLMEFSNLITRQRDKAALVTQELTLSESMFSTSEQFEQLLTNLTLFPSPVNSDTLLLIVNSNPNFNFLYSNYSKSYSEPLSALRKAGVEQSYINVLYGPDLDKIDQYRLTNQVDIPTWLKGQFCNFSEPNYLLRGNNAAVLSDLLCSSFTDSQLVILFTLISSQLDYSKVKQTVYENTSISDFQFVIETFKAVEAGLTLQSKIKEANVFDLTGSGQGDDFFSFYQRIQTDGFGKTICGNSKLTIFDIFDSLQINQAYMESFIEFINTNNIGRSSSVDVYSSVVNLMSNNFSFDPSSQQSSSSQYKAIKVSRNNLHRANEEPERNRRQAETSGPSINMTRSLTLLLLESFNNLNSFNDTTCPAKRIVTDLDPATQILINSTSKTCFCKTMYVIIATLSEDTQVLFRQLKPMLLGKLVYAPNTPAYQKLIERANTTFANIDKLGQLIKQTADVLTQMMAQNSGNEESFKMYSELEAMLGALLNVTTPVLDFEKLKTETKLLTQVLYFTANLLECFELNKFVGYPDESSAVAAGSKLIHEEVFWAALIFKNPETTINGQAVLPEIVNYKIRMNASLTHDTTYTQDRIYRFGPSNCLGCNAYFLYGFIYVQDILEKAIIEMKSNKTQFFGLVSQMMPYPCYVSDKFVSAISKSMPLFMVLAWIYTVSMMVKDIVYEKERRLKEFMRVMGLSNGIHWLSWFITSFSLMFFIIIILCVVLKYGQITSFSDITCLIVFFTCFTIATITQCFLISIFFNRANLAAVVAGILYFLLYLPYTILVNYDDVIQPWQKFLASLSSTVAFSYGCELLAAFELQNKGINWQTFYTTPFARKDAFSLNAVCLILLLDAFIYMLLTWYIEALWPGEYGIPRPWYFPVQPSYWCGESKRISKSSLKTSCSCLSKLYDKCWFSSFDVNESKKSEDESHSDSLSESVEKISIDERPGIKIDKLEKVYKRGNNHALKGLSVNFYENEITAFLGHNGAGKSTTMHLLIGLYKPTAGTAYINGLDITESMDTIRKSLGFVPQHNVLFDTMTVKEHLWFYARLKGLSSDATKKESEKMLDDTGLRPKKNELTRDLSGGMQRKLSVAIAFVGGSKTVILDEPSAGVDPSGRRGIWDLLFKYREGRTVVISTHHLDEADVLGDRIAIISNGKLVAHGTSYFLKNKFGRGYYLTLAKKQYRDAIDKQKEGLKDGFLSREELIPGVFDGSQSSSTDSGARSLYTNFSDNGSDLPSIGKSSSGLDTSSNSTEILHEENLLKTLDQADKRIDKFIRANMPNACLIQSVGSELTYSISNKPEYTRTYSKFFSQLELNMDYLGLESVGLSDSTLEEIFIKLAKQPQNNSSSSTISGCMNISWLWQKFINCTCCRRANPDESQLTEAQIAQYSEFTKLRLSSKPLMINQQLYALIIKRFHRVKRNIKGFFAEIVLPIMFVCLALLVATLNPTESSEPPLEIHPWYYDSPNQMFLAKSSSYDYDRPVYGPNGQLSLNLNENIQPNIDSINQVFNSILQSPGPGTRCMSNYQIVISHQAQDYSRASGDRMLTCSEYSSRLISNQTMPPQNIIDELNKVNYTYSKTSLPCDCANGFPECPASASGDIYFRPIYKLKTEDILYDLSGRNISDWIINTEFSDNMFRKRFGGFEFLMPFVNTTDDLLDRLMTQIQMLPGSVNIMMGSTFNSTNMENLTAELFNNENANALLANQNIKIWFNNKGYDSSTAYLNVINNALLRSQMSSTGLDMTRHGIVLFNHPMPYTQGEYLSKLESNVMIDLFVAVCMVFALSFIPASFLVFLLEERQNNSKQLQFVSGVRPYIYWVSNYVWDLVNYIVPVLLCILIFVGFNVEAYICAENFPCLIALMLLYGWACIPLMYPLNYLFKVPSTAFVVSSSLNVFVGVISTMTVTVLEQLGDSEPDLLHINNILKPVFTCFLPHFCLGQGFLQMSLLYNTAAAQRSYGYTVEFSPFGFNDVGRNLCAMALQGIVYFSFNLLIQYKFFIHFKPTRNVEKLKLPKNEDEDDDVLNEKNRILMKEMNAKLNKKSKFNPFRSSQSTEVVKSNPDEDYIRLINLTKVYKKLTKCGYQNNVAVNNLSLGINKGECFGLIGVNGAGKTTTFKMITGEIPISGGDVYIGENSVSKQLEKVHRNIGYCPQSDAIFPLLTAREHLIFYARLRGIPEKYVKKVSEWALHRVGLQVFADRISGDFSGGNKRKLSTAIALVGDPSVICLDEPTSGMDAKARRLLWNDILSLIKENRIVILTSHSMEECEALCTRLVIMVNGQFKCLGSPQHLKTKFGSGYLLTVRLNHESNRDSLFKFMKKYFPQSVIQESHKTIFEFVLPFSSTRLSYIFNKIEKHRGKLLDLKDYSISQTTLDQIFINFAKQQKDDPFLPTSTNEQDDYINIEKGSIKGSITGSTQNYVRSSSFEYETQQGRISHIDHDTCDCNSRRSSLSKKPSATAAEMGRTRKKSISLKNSVSFPNNKIGDLTASSRDLNCSSSNSLAFTKARQKSATSMDKIILTPDNFILPVPPREFKDDSRINYDNEYDDDLDLEITKF